MKNDDSIIIRRYKNEDLQEVATLFYETVHTVNIVDYSLEQIEAWAPSIYSLKERREDLLKQYTLIAEMDGKIVGFGSMTVSGCLDLLYVHKDYLKNGIATCLCNNLENSFTQIRTFASVTAKPFFEKRGYTVVKSQEVVRSGIKLKNYEMLKMQL